MNETRLLPNPHSGSPERRKTIAKRLLTVLGGVATGCIAFKYGVEADSLGADKGLLYSIGALSFVIAAAPIITEISERLGGIDGGGGNWTPPDAPSDPTPGGTQMPLIDEIEGYLAGKTPVSV